MKKYIGYILTIAGIIGSVYFLIAYMDETKFFDVFGSDIMISQGNLSPLITSIAVLVTGVVLLTTSKKR